MRLSAKVEYACLAVLELAVGQEKAQPTRIKEISANHHIPDRFLVQILLQLKTAGLVKSVRGAAGGYRLSRSPEEISIADVIRAVDDRSLSGPETTQASKTALGQALTCAWNQVFREEIRILEELKLAELLRRANMDESLVYQI